MLACERRYKFRAVYFLEALLLAAGKLLVAQQIGHHLPRLGGLCRRLFEIVRGLGIDIAGKSLEHHIEHGLYGVHRRLELVGDHP